MGPSPSKHSMRSVVYLKHASRKQSQDRSELCPTTSNGAQTPEVIWNVTQTRGSPHIYKLITQTLYSISCICVYKFLAQVPTILSSRNGTLFFHAFQVGFYCHSGGKDLQCLIRRKKTVFWGSTRIYGFFRERC